jgi:uncharacterized membrane protein (DUF485 family)
MDHGSAAKMDKDNASEIKSKIGLILFAVYGLIYAGFIAINTLWPKVMEIYVLLGLNLAVVYGFGLIILAIIMGLIYNAICTNYEKKLNVEENEK